MEFGFTNLGSGSKGNASVIHSSNGNLLLDNGFSAKELQKRMEDACIDPDSISAVLLTHSHADHIRNLCFCRTKHLKTYLLKETFHDIYNEKKSMCIDPDSCIWIEPGQTYEICGIQVKPFEVPHDVPTVGYTFNYRDYKIGYATDLGEVGNLAQQRLRACNLLVIESNFDTKLLNQSQRPERLKRRIAGKTGHLKNETTQEILEKVVTDKTKHIVFAHLSEECNSPEIVRKLTKKRLCELNRNDILFYIANQNNVLPTIWVT